MRHERLCRAAVGKKRAKGILGFVRGHAARQSGRVLRPHCPPGRFHFGPVRVPAGQACQHALLCAGGGAGAFSGGLRAWHRPHTPDTGTLFPCGLPASGRLAVRRRCTGAGAARPSLRRAVLYNARGRACGPGGCAGVCAAAAGYGRSGLPACARRRAAGQAWCGACICAPRVALKCEKGYNILVTFQAMPAIALRKAGRKGGGGNGAKA